MPFKCPVVNCRSGYIGESDKSMFSFPRNADLRQRWIAFLNRDGFEVTSSSRICIEQFDSKYLSHNLHKTGLNMSLNPIPTILLISIRQSQAIIPKSIRKPPTKRVLQPDQLHLFKKRFAVSSFDDVVKYIKSAIEYPKFTHCISEASITTYRVEISSGIAQVNECALKVLLYLYQIS